MNPAGTMKPTKEPQFDADEFEEVLVTSQQKNRNVIIKYEGYFYEGAFRIVKLCVDLNDLKEYHFDYLEDQITESIGLRINKNNIVLETKIEYL